MWGIDMGKLREILFFSAAYYVLTILMASSAIAQPGGGQSPSWGVVEQVHPRSKHLQLIDDIQLKLGTDTDYWLTYSNSSTQFELRSTNVNGSGTDGLVLFVDDGTDDVTFSGLLSLPDGAAATPSIIATGDVDTGVFVDSAPKSVGLSIDGTALIEVRASTVFIRNQKDLTAGSCTANDFAFDTVGTKELCFCFATNTWTCWSATTANGPAD